MNSKKSKIEYPNLEKEIDLQTFRDSVLEYFSSIKDLRSPNKTIYPLWYLFFIILSAMLAGVNSIHQIAIFAKAKNKWIKNLTGLPEIPTSGVFW